MTISNAMSSIEQLPEAPSYKKGWPWTEQSDAWPEKMENGMPWPRITIVTPSFNQGEYIEETIRSVILQRYPNLEYIIMDGGSKDHTVQVLEKYTSFITHWESKKDEGQTHAINKGFAVATGEIIAWLNSDDFYTKNAFQHLQPAIPADWKMGHIQKVRDGALIGLRRRDMEPDRAIGRCFKNGGRKDFAYSQPASFWSRGLVNRVGALNEKYNYIMDADFILRSLAVGYQPTRIEAPLVNFRLHAESKTISQQSGFEIESAQMFLQFSIQKDFNFTPCLSLAYSHFWKYIFIRFSILKRIFK